MIRYFRAKPGIRGGHNIFCHQKSSKKLNSFSNICTEFVKIGGNYSNEDTDVGKILVINQKTVVNLLKLKKISHY